MWVLKTEPWSFARVFSGYTVYSPHHFSNDRLCSDLVQKLISIELRKMVTIDPHMESESPEKSHEITIGEIIIGD